MSFSFGFFNAKNMDRTYTAEDFTSYLSSIICNGVFDTYGDCSSATVEKSDSDTVQNYIYTSVTSGNCVELPFYWLYCDTFTTGLTACDSATDGEYYLCLVCRSNNTHPIVREVKVMN